MSVAMTNPSRTRAWALVGSAVVACLVAMPPAGWAQTDEPAPVRVGGGGVRLTLVLEPADARRLRRMLRGRRRARATVTVVATDAAGNSSATKLPPIALRR